MGPARKVPTKLEVLVYLDKWEIDTTNNGNNTKDENIILSFCPVYFLRVVKKDTIGDNSNIVALVTFTKILFVHVLDMT